MQIRSWNSVLATSVFSVDQLKTGIIEKNYRMGGRGPYSKDAVGNGFRNGVSALGQKKDGPCYADDPEAHADRWKGAPQARNRLYPSVFKLSEENGFVNKKTGDRI